MGNANTPCNCHKATDAATDLDALFAQDAPAVDDLLDFAGAEGTTDEGLLELDLLNLDDELAAAQDLDALLENEEDREPDGGGMDMEGLYALLKRYPGLQITLSCKN